jgi:hypothetical protein
MLEKMIFFRQKTKKIGTCHGFPAVTCAGLLKKPDFFNSPSDKKLLRRDQSRMPVPESRTPAGSSFSVGQTRRDQSLESVESCLFVVAVSDERYRHSARDADRQNTEQTFGVNLSFILDHPDRALVGIRFLNEEGRRSGVKPSRINNCNIALCHF